jgi:hypothetical protein
MSVRWPVVGLTLLVVAAGGSAQSPDPLLGVPAAARPVDPLLNPPPLPAAPGWPNDHWRLAVDVGLPMGLRVQRRIGQTNWWGEAGVGAWWVVPYASACLRYDVCALRGERNLFAVRPGVSATAVGFVAPAVGLDCEFIWQHCWNGKVTTEFGARLGMSAVFLGDRDGWVSGTLPAPVACLTFGWQF